MSDDDRVVVVEVTIAAPADEVWASLRDPERIRHWHGWEYDGLEAEIRQIQVDGAEADEAARTIEFDELGDGLVILHAPPHGGGRAILTTYGPDDAAVTALEQRWTAWMAQA